MIGRSTSSNVDQPFCRRLVCTQMRSLSLQLMASVCLSSISINHTTYRPLQSANVKYATPPAILLSPASPLRWFYTDPVVDAWISRLFHRILTQTSRFSVLNLCVDTIVIRDQLKNILIASRDMVGIN